MTPVEAYELIVRIASVGVIISSLELLSLRRHLVAGGVLAYRPRPSALIGLLAGLASKPLHSILAPRPFLCAISIRTGAAIYLLVAPTPGGTSAAAIMAVVVVSLLLQLRNPYGLDGSDQMSLVVFGALLVVVLAPEDQVLAYAALGFISAQAYLAYLTSGIAKLISTVWRSGNALIGIFSTEAYGHPGLGSLVGRSRATAVGGAWLVIAFECLFPLATISSEPGLVVALAVGVVFHAGTAFAMGLNSFVWSFVATYPAVACIAEQIRLVG